MHFKLPNRSCIFTSLGLMIVVIHSALCSKSDEKDHCVDNMATVDGISEDNLLGNHERLCGNAEKVLTEEIRNGNEEEYV